NFRSCGASPMETNGKICVPVPIDVSPSITTCESTTTFSARRTPAPMTEYAPTLQLLPISAASSTIAVLCMDAGISETVAVGCSAVRVRAFSEDKPDENNYGGNGQKDPGKGSADRRYDQARESEQGTPLEDTQKQW